MNHTKTIKTILFDKIIYLLASLAYLRDHYYFLQMFGKRNIFENIDGIRRVVNTFSKSEYLEIAGEKNLVARHF